MVNKLFCASMLARSDIGAELVKLDAPRDGLPLEVVAWVLLRGALLPLMGASQQCVSYEDGVIPR